MNVKTDITVVTQRGQTSIPARLRKAMGLAKGTRLVWEQLSEQEARVRRVRARKPDPVAMLGFARRHGLGLSSTDEYLRGVRAGEDDA